LPRGDLSIDLSTEAVAKAEASAKLEALRGRQIIREDHRV
jgi:hypothetical protein